MSLEELSQELLSYAQGHPECLDSLNRQLEILLADLQSMQTNSVPKERIEYKELYAWKLLCEKYGDNPSSEVIQFVARQVSDLLQVPICRQLQRRKDLLIQWLNGYINELEQTLCQHVVC